MRIPRLKDYPYDIDFVVVSVGHKTYPSHVWSLAGSAFGYEF